MEKVIDVISTVGRTFRGWSMSATRRNRLPKDWVRAAHAAADDVCHASERERPSTSGEGRAEHIRERAVVVASVAREMGACRDDLTGLVFALWDTDTLHGSDDVVRETVESYLDVTAHTTDANLANDWVRRELG